MSKKRNKKAPVSRPIQSNTEQFTPNEQAEAEMEPEYYEEPPPPQEPSTMEKLALLSDLAKLIANPDFINFVTSQPSGEFAYNIFKRAAEDMVEKTVSGQQSITQEDSNQAVSLLGVSRETVQVMNDFKNLIVSFINTPLVGTLEMLNNSLVGAQDPYARQSYYDTQHDPHPVPQPPPRQPPPQPQRPQHPPQRQQYPQNPPPTQRQQQPPGREKLEYAQRMQQPMKKTAIDPLTGQPSGEYEINNDDIRNAVANRGGRSEF